MVAPACTSPDASWQPSCRTVSSRSTQSKAQSTKPSICCSRRRPMPPSLRREPPEALQDGVVDLGAVAAEFLLLGIDPYPRKEGAAFDAPPVADPSGHPFAALATLKKGGEPKDR